MTNSRHGIAYATCAWCVLFGAPHLWWALGWPFGFAGGRAMYNLFMSSAWRVAFNGSVIGCCALGVLVALTLSMPQISAARRRVTLVLAWVAFVLLSLRGVAGLIVDQLQDHIWDPTFVVGGALFGAVIWRARRSRRTYAALPSRQG